jgi:hypothetical protein
LETNFQARRAYDKFVRGDIKVGSGSSEATFEPRVSSSISTLPSYVLGVNGMSVDKSVTELLEEVTKDAAGVTTISPLNTDRTALLKFRRNSDVSC